MTHEPPQDELIAWLDGFARLGTDTRFLSEHTQARVADVKAIIEQVGGLRSQVTELGNALDLLKEKCRKMEERAETAEASLKDESAKSEAFHSRIQALEHDNEEKDRASRRRQIAAESEAAQLKTSRKEVEGLNELVDELEQAAKRPRPAP